MKNMKIKQEIKIKIDCDPHGYLSINEMGHCNRVAEKFCEKTVRFYQAWCLSILASCDEPYKRHREASPRIIGD